MAFIQKKESTATTDFELVQEYRNSQDLHVLGTLYNRYMELVYGVCLKYLKDSEAAKDAVLSIYEELITKLKQHEVENFKSWLYTLSRNYCLMQLRKQKGKQTTEISDRFMQTAEETHLEDVREKEEQLTFMEECMKLLIADQQVCVSLFYLENKCYNEIAEATGMDWNKVRSHIQNGKRNLKLCVEEKIKQKS
ncbi:MAG: sigma-70 family RNA polymerase sigma factor [Chitinophagaceae bacterium]